MKGYWGILGSREKDGLSRNATKRHLVPELRSLGTALLTGASVASILIGIAAHSTLGNMVVGLSLILYRPFAIGDSVRLTVARGVEKAGIVEDLTLGYTPFEPQTNSVMVSQAIIKETSKGNM